MHVGGKLVLAVADVPTFKEELGSVLPSILTGVVVEVLVHVRAAIRASAAPPDVGGEVVLHPAGFVNVVDEEVAEAATRRPEKAVEALDLPEQLGGL